MGLSHILARFLPTSTNRLRRAASRFVAETLRTEIIRQIEQIPGCLNVEQGSLLCYLAANPPGAGCIVEIGSFMGRSTVWLAHGLRLRERRDGLTRVAAGASASRQPPERPTRGSAATITPLHEPSLKPSSNRVISIDPHAGHERPGIRPDLDSYESFLANIRQAGVADLVEPIRDTSQAVARQWNQPIRLLWIDGSHAYDDVLADLEGFARHVIPGGHVALHDTRGRGFPGVRKAMLEYFGRHREFDRIAGLRNMTIYIRK